MTLRAGVLAALLLLVGLNGFADGRAQVDRVTVTADRRGDRTWTILDSQVSVEVPIEKSALVSVIEDWNAYPKVFPKIQDAGFEIRDGAVFLTETVVVSFFSVKSVNHFTLKIVRTDSADGRSTRLEWTQAATDGTIDDLWGFWTLEDRGTPAKPLTRVVYRTRSAVPELMLGQAFLLPMFVGGETQGALEAVVKIAASK